MTSRVGANEPCPCGSGKKYKKCCRILEEGRALRTSQAASSRSLQEKNLALLSSIHDIFGLNRPWSVVKERMELAQIREFYKYAGELWPVYTDYRKILPVPDSKLKALYLGENEPELMLANVFRFSLYADQILIVNPLPNPNVIAEKFNPIYHPGEWKLQTIRFIFHMTLLAPWIESGLVVLLPDPGDFDRELRVKTWDMATERLRGWHLSEDEVKESAMRHRTADTFFMAPREYLERTAKEANPGSSDEEIRRLVDLMEQKRSSDPLLLNETLDNLPPQMMVSNMGTNLEMGMFICQATGAFPYTNVKFRWKEILGAGQQLDDTARVWSPLTKAFQNLEFKFLNKVDSQFACSIRQQGRLEGFRSYMRRLWNTVGGEPDLTMAERLARDFSDELSQAFNEAEGEWKSIDRELLKWATPTLAGAIATGAFSLALPTLGFAIAGLGEIVQAEMKRREFRRRVPMSVFIDLANQ